MFNKKYDILHIFNDPKFSLDYFKLLQEYQIPLEKHQLFHYRCSNKTCSAYDFIDRVFAKHFFSIIPNIRLLKCLFNSNTIVIHGLASPYLLLYLFLFPFLCKKVYWVIWGKDLYFYSTLQKKRLTDRIYEFFRKHVIKNIDKVITFNQGDFEHLKRYYHTNPKRYNCFAYPSNLFKVPPPSPKEKTPGKPIRILVGNSADPDNNHSRALHLLEPFRLENIEIYVPLSYGDKTYAKEIITQGKSIFGNKFTPFQKLIPRDEYHSLLSKIDVGLFVNSRQQAMGNITQLLGMGKKVYLNPDITTWDLMTELGVTLYDPESFDLERCPPAIAKENQAVIKRVFSKANLIQQWQDIFHDAN